MPPRAEIQWLTEMCYLYCSTCRSSSLKSLKMLTTKSPSYFGDRGVCFSRFSRFLILGRCSFWRRQPNLLIGFVPFGCRRVRSRSVRVAMAAEHMAGHQRRDLKCNGGIPICDISRRAMSLRVLASLNPGYKPVSYTHLTLPTILLV